MCFSVRQQTHCFQTAVLQKHSCFCCMQTYNSQTCSRGLAESAFCMKQAGQHSTHAELLGRLRAEQLPWTELMDKAMLAAHEEGRATPADVQAACDKISMHAHMKEARTVCLQTTTCFRRPKAVLTAVSFLASHPCLSSCPALVIFCLTIIVNQQHKQKQT